jgi:hypothetical protein
VIVHWNVTGVHDFALTAYDVLTLPPSEWTHEALSAFLAATETPVHRRRTSTAPIGPWLTFDGQGSAIDGDGCAPRDCGVLRKADWPDDPPV